MIPTIEQLKENWDTAYALYSKEQRKMKLLDATDKGDLWKAINAKFPPYQILPDTNYVSYVKNNLLASLYTVAKSASLLPTSEKDKSLVTTLNIHLERIWKLLKVGYYQFQAGEKAALTNMGITQVGWRDDVSGGTGDAFYKGNVTLKNIDPLKFMRDPYATDLESASFCMTYDDFHKSVFLADSRYKENFQKYLEKNKASQMQSLPQSDTSIPKSGAKNYYSLIIHWVRENSSIHEVHTINNEYILYSKENIKPNCYPFAILYCNLPSGSLVGTSECSKIFANNVALNLMDSIALTAEYKNQRPPKFVNAQSGLNINSFNKYGNEADHTFIVQGDASKAVHYHQFPFVSPNLPQLKQSLSYAIQEISGVDGRYTGRDTGSITTTGGMQDMLGRVTLIDTPKIVNYEDYSSTLSKLIIYNYIEFSPKRKYFYRKPNTNEWLTTEVDFPKIDSATLFDYEMDISSELPRNKQRIAAAATALMEKQMQYGNQGGVNLITEEEWLMLQDLPFKEFMLERMGVERLSDVVEDVTQTLFQYAELVKNGMPADDAILATASTLDQKRKGLAPQEEGDPTLIPPVAQNF